MTQPAMYGGKNCPALSQSRGCNVQCCPGHYGPADLCFTCPSGTYQDGSGQGSCAVCPAGKFQAFEGQTSCDACAKGRFGDITLGMSHAGHCVQCLPGRYQEYDGKFKCVQCESGEYVAGHGAEACAACPAGQWTANMAGQTSCSPIPIDCVMNTWANWGSCSAQCGGGTKTRSRTVHTQPANGPSCPSTEETASCNDHSCAVDCEYEQWGSWDACAVTCGGGAQTRSRGIKTWGRHGGLACTAPHRPSAND